MTVSSVTLALPAAYSLSTMGTTFPAPGRRCAGGRCTDIADLKDAITYVVHRHAQVPGANALTRTRLVKLLYLADLLAVDRLGAPLTDVRWKSYYYGPFSQDVLAAADDLDGDTILQNVGFLSTGSPFYSYVPTRRSDTGLGPEERTVLDQVIDQYAQRPLQEILDHVYENTPYREARQLGDTIDLRAR